jgi:hypothetical protein
MVSIRYGGPFYLPGYCIENHGPWWHITPLVLVAQLESLRPLRNCFTRYQGTPNPMHRLRRISDEVKTKLNVIRRRKERIRTQTRKRKVILGRVLPITDELADTAHLSILNFPAESNGRISSVTVHLGQEPPGEGLRWEVLVYSMIGGHRFSLVAKRQIQIDPTCRRPQRIAVKPPLTIGCGQERGCPAPGHSESTIETHFMTFLFTAVDCDSFARQRIHRVSHFA